MLGEGLPVEAARAGCRGRGLSGVTVPQGGLASLQGGVFAPGCKVAALPLLWG